MEAPKGRKEGVVPRVDLLEARREGDFLDVMVGEIYSPEKFYLQVLYSIQPPSTPQLLVSGQQYDLDDLTDDLEDGYRAGAGPGQLLEAGELVLHLHCAVNLPAEKNSKWYRAEVTGVEEGLVQVYLLDMGLVAAVPSTPGHLRRLLAQYCGMPAQAARARLDLRPPGSQWQEDSTDLFLELTSRACSAQGVEAAGLVALVQGWDPDGTVVVRLYDTVVMMVILVIMVFVATVAIVVIVVIVVIRNIKLVSVTLTEVIVVIVVIRPERVYIHHHRVTCWLVS